MDAYVDLNQVFTFSGDLISHGIDTRRGMTADQIRFLGLAEDLFLQRVGDLLVMDLPTFRQYYLDVMGRFRYRGRGFKTMHMLFHCLSLFDELFDKPECRWITWVDVSHILCIFLMNCHRYEGMFKEDLDIQK